MKTPRRGLKTSLCKVFLKNQILHNNRFTILVLQHSCSKNSISGSKTLQFIFEYKRKMFKNFIRESVKESLTQNYNIFCIFITIVYGGKSFSLELSNFSGHSGRARCLIKAMFALSVEKIIKSFEQLICITLSNILLY